ncbi:MAG TPA: site-specific integrase [Pseudomonas sp.]|jgi:site-specific recombinase XerD
MKTPQANIFPGGSVTCFDPYFPSFESSLADKNYKPGTIKTYRVVIRRLASVMEARGIAPEHLTLDLAAQLVRSEERNRREPNKYQNIARRFAQHLIVLGVASAAVPTEQQIERAKLQAGYEEYLRRQRGLSERTIFHAWRFADRFLDHCFGDANIDLGATCAGDVIAFLQSLLSRKTPYRDKTVGTHLRNFFQYLFKSGLTTSNIALCVPKVAQQRVVRLPRHLSPDQVEAVLTAVRVSPKHGRRDYAMLLLMARLGLRAPEVIAIQIDDIDWRAGELLVHGKGQQQDRMPLPPDVGEALANYIRHDRIAASRTLFVTKRAPNGPFKNGQVVNALLKDAFAATGVKPPSPYVGSHVLRHSLATNMVRKGASLAEVGDVLRHRSRSSTMIYAKLDIDGLRSIAQPWPVAGGVQ